MVQMNKLIKLLLIVLPLFFSITCIERNNPWDPINGCPEEVKADYRQDQASQIEALRSSVLLLSSKIADFLDVFAISKESVDSIFFRNDSIKLTEPGIRSFNDSIDTYNKSVDCVLLDLKDTFAILDTVKLFYPDSVYSLMNQFKLDSLNIISIVADGNEHCQPLGIYNRVQMDSIFEPLSIFSAKRDSLTNMQDNYSRTYADSNNSIGNYNQNLLQQNQKILQYNDSIGAVKFICQKNIIVKIDTLRKRIEDLKPGDTLFLGDTSFVDAQLDFTGKGDSTKQIVIMGSSFMNTILDSVRLFITNCNNIKFENIVVQNAGTTSGVKIQENSKDIVFTNCVIKNNGLYGIESAGSSIRLENCILTNNLEGGVKIDKGQNSSDVRFDGIDVIIANNGKHGIYSIRATVILYNATISDNDSNGVYFNSPQTSSIFNSTIFSFNGISGVFHDRSENVNGIVYFTNCDFYNNTVENINIKDQFVAINSNAHYDDPVFVDKNQNNYRISTSSILHGEDIGYRYTK
jgi:hypothetical protein